MWYVVCGITSHCNTTGKALLVMKNLYRAIAMGVIALAGLGSFGVAASAAPTQVGPAASSSDISPMANCGSCGGSIDNGGHCKCS